MDVQPVVFGRRATTRLYCSETKSHVYALHMLDTRLQILLSKQQRSRLEAESRERGQSVGELVREALDARYGSRPASDRIRAFEEIAAMRAGSAPSPEEINRLVDEERDAAAPKLAR